MPAPESESKAMRALLFLAMTVLLSLSATASEGVLLEVNGALLKWYPEPTGGRTVITYALLTDPYSLPNKAHALSPDNCSSMNGFESILTATPTLTSETARRELRAAFSV